MMSGWGGKKFFLPRIMNEPVGRNSPVGAVLDTCRGECAGGGGG